MRSFLIVVYYTISQAIKKKSFWIINAIMAGIIFLIFSLVSTMSIPDLSFNDSSSGKSLLEITYEAIGSDNSDANKEKTTDEIENEDSKSNLPKILIVDKTNIFGTHLNLLLESNYNFSIDNSIDTEVIKQEIIDENLYAAIFLNKVDGAISFDYMVLEDTKYNNADIRLISSLLKQVQVTKTLKELNVSSEKINTLNQPIGYNIETLKDNTAIDNATIISICLASVLFFAIYFYSYTVSASVSSEKTSRVIETLITSTSSKSVIIGKTIGMGILGLLQLFFLCIVCVISYKLVISSDLNFLNELIKSVDITTTNILLLLTFFMLGYVLFAFLNAITGATVSKPEDVQMANLPISLISVVSLVLTFFAFDPSQEAKGKFASLFPFSSPFAMPRSHINRICRYLRNHCIIINFISFCDITCVYINQNLFYRHTTLWK